MKHAFFFPLLTLLLLVWNPASAQEKRRFDYVLSPGIAWQGTGLAELNLLVGEYDSSPCGSALAGVRIGAETNFASGKELLFAPKVGFELSSTPICLRATALTYINGRHAQLRLLPELGISIGSFVNLTYGYSIALNRSEFFDLSGHRVTLSFNLNGDVIYGL